MKSLYLNHLHPQWWQWVTSIFCHANWAHLSGNIFFLYVFGKIVEEEEGFFGVWFSYLFTGVVGGSPAALLSTSFFWGGTRGMCGLGSTAAA